MDNKEIVQAILDFIQKTGTILIQTGFAMSVKYVIAQAIGQIVTGILSSISTVFFISKVYKAFNNGANKNESDDAFGFKVDVLIFLAVISLIVFAFSSPIEGIKMLIAPEWYAILNIIKLVK